MIEYRYDNDLGVDEVIELLQASTLGERRPVDDKNIIAKMIQYGNLTVTAWENGKLVGLARTLTDFDYVGYLSDLAVHQEYQNRGIGKKLIELTRQKMGPRSMLVLLSAPKAVDYYPKIGFTQHPSAWILKKTDPFSEE